MWRLVLSKVVLSVPAIVTILLFGSCSASTEPTKPENDPIIESDTIELITTLNLDSIWRPSSREDSAPLKVGIFLYARQTSTSPTWSQRDAIGIVDSLLQSSVVFKRCSIGFELEVAQVIFLPTHLLNVEGNTIDSWGGHPPEGTENPALFNYEENNRLTLETRELFGYGKRYTSPNTISIFIVRDITFYTGGQAHSSSGLSFSPNLYHHVDDYPLRNSVLIALATSSNRLPAVDSYTNFVVPHELGHMMLNTGLHLQGEDARDNLMNDWGDTSTTLTTEQCERIRYIVPWLYGEEEIADPGPPSS